MGQHQRQAWFGCACCPSNAARFIPSFPQYIYAVKDDAFYVNLFASNETTVKVGGNSVSSGSQIGAGTQVDIEVTPAEGQTPTAMINGSNITLTESDGTYTGSFQMPATSATLVINSGGSTGGGVDQN